jgi:hypothetical protein
MMTLFRLTINKPGIQKDKEVLGDRTLAAYVNQKAYIFSTYNYANIDDISSG